MSARILLAVAALCPVAASSAQGSNGAARAGLYGTVVIYPATPVCRVGVPCSRPAEGVTLVFSRHGRVVTTTRTGKGGRYRISLAAGRYAVRVRAKSHLGTGLHPAAATVPRGRFARLNFSYDVGIR